MLQTNLAFRKVLFLGTLALAFVVPGSLAAADDAVPSAFDKSRYESLRGKSPFAMATAVAAPTAQASFAVNWFVTGVARIGDMNFVTIKSRDLTTQFSLYGEESVDGVMLASVNWSDTIGKSTVILRKGTETARLEFNEAQLRAVATAAASPAPNGANAATMKAAAANAQAAGANMTNANAVAAAQNAGGPPRRRLQQIPMPR